MIIVKKGQFVDFKAPVFMSESQRNKFIDFMRELFPKIGVEEIQEKGKEFLNRKPSENRDWTDDELVELFNEDNDFEDIMKKTKRSDMSIAMMMGDYYTQIMSWAYKKGYSKITKEMLKEYRNEMGAQK